MATTTSVLKSYGTLADYHTNMSSAENSAVVCAAPCIARKIGVLNISAAPLYLLIFDDTAVVETDVPTHPALGVNESFSFTEYNVGSGMPLGTGLCVAISTDATQYVAPAPAAGHFHVIYEKHP